MARYAGSTRSDTSGIDRLERMGLLASEARNAQFNRDLDNEAMKILDGGGTMNDVRSFVIQANEQRTRKRGGFAGFIDRIATDVPREDSTIEAVVKAQMFAGQGQGQGMDVNVYSKLIDVRDKLVSQLEIAKSGIEQGADVATLQQQISFVDRQLGQVTGGQDGPVLPKSANGYVPPVPASGTATPYSGASRVEPITEPTKPGSIMGKVVDWAKGKPMTSAAPSARTTAIGEAFRGMEPAAAPAAVDTSKLPRAMSYLKLLSPDDQQTVMSLIRQHPDRTDDEWIKLLSKYSKD